MTVNGDPYELDEVPFWEMSGEEIEQDRLESMSDDDLVADILNIALDLQDAIQEARKRGIDPSEILGDSE